MKENRFLKTIADLRNPTSGLFDLLNQPKPKYVYPILLSFGFICGIQKILIEYIFSLNEITLQYSVTSVLSSTIKIFIVLNLFILIAYYLSSFLGGTASIKMTATVVSYSLIPVIIGVASLCLLRFILFVLIGIPLDQGIIVIVSYVLYLPFLVFSLRMLTIGIAIAGNFTLFKAFISSTIFVLGYSIYEVTMLFR